MSTSAQIYSPVNVTFEVFLLLQIHTRDAPFKVHEKAETSELYHIYIIRLGQMNNICSIDSSSRKITGNLFLPVFIQRKINLTLLSSSLNVQSTKLQFVELSHISVCFTSRVITRDAPFLILVSSIGPIPWASTCTCTHKNVLTLHTIGYP